MVGDYQVVRTIICLLSFRRPHQLLPIFIIINKAKYHCAYIFAFCAYYIKINSLKWPTGLPSKRGPGLGSFSSREVGRGPSVLADPLRDPAPGCPRPAPAPCGLGSPGGVPGSRPQGWGPATLHRSCTYPCRDPVRPRGAAGAGRQPAASEPVLGILPHLFFLSYLCFLCSTTVFLSVYSAFLLCLCLLIFPYSPNILMASFNLIFIVNCRESVSIRSIFRASAMIGLLVLS